MQLSIRAQIKNSYRNWDVLQAILEQAMDDEAKSAQQASLLVWENDTPFYQGYRLLKNKESEDQKDFEIC